MLARPSLRRARRDMRLDLTDLTLFRHVAEAGSITAGAARANLALAAASTRVRGMEEEVGTRLFVRGRAGITLTPAGQSLLVYARQLLEGAARMREELGTYGGPGGGQVKILSNTNALTEFLPEALGRFLAANPQMSVDIQERLSDEIVGLVAEGVADLGIVAATADPAALETYPFRTDRFVLVVPVGHAMAGWDQVAFEQVLHLDFVGLDGASALQRFLTDRAQRLGRRLGLRVRLRSFDGVCRMVAAGVGIGIVPESTMRGMPRAIGVRSIPLCDAWAVRQLLLCVRSLAELAPNARRLADHLLLPPHGTD